MFVCKGDLVHAAKESFHSIDRVKFGLRAERLFSEMPTSGNCPMETLSQNRLGIFRESVASSFIASFLVLSLTLKLADFPFHLYLGVTYQLAGLGGFLPWRVSMP